MSEALYLLSYWKEEYWMIKTVNSYFKIKGEDPKGNWLDR